MNRWVAVLAGIVFIAGCSSGPKSRVEKGGDLSRTMDEQMTGKKWLEAIGIGAADSAMTNQTQRMATSRNAAVVAAQHEMLSTIKGTRLQGGITVEKAIETDSKLQTTIDEVIKGAEIVKSEWTKDDGCVVTIRLEKDRLQRMMGVQFE
jgi:hypothetical protein